MADTFDEAFGVDDVGGLGDELAGQRNAFVDRLPARGVALRRARASADDDHLAECRLVLVLELGPVTVVAPRAKRRGKPDPGRCIGVEVEAAEVDDGGLFSPDVSSRAAAAPPSFSAISAGELPPPVPTTTTRRKVPPSSTNCSATLEASPSKRWRSSAAATAACAGPSEESALRSLPATGSTSAKSPAGRLSAKRTCI